MTNDRFAEAVAPSASVARAVSVVGPSGRAPVQTHRDHGAAVAVASTVVPRRNSTLVSSMSSDAVAASSTESCSTAPAAGDDQATVGGAFWAGVNDHASRTAPVLGFSSWNPA